MAPGEAGIVTRGTPPFTMPVLPAPNLFPMRPDSAEATSGLIPASAEELRRPNGITPFGGEVTRRPPSTMPIAPPPWPPATESQSISGDENPYEDPPRERIPCLRCKENSIDCHGPETKYYGDCSKCHEAGKRCEFEVHALNALSSSPNPQSSAIDDGTPQPTPSTNSDNGTHINIPDPQPNTSSGRQIYQKSPVVDESRERATSNTIDGITNDDSISGEPRIRPWWKRIFSRIFCSR